MKKSFVVYSDAAEIVEQLTEKQTGRLFRAMLKHAKGEKVDLDQLLTLVFTPIRQTMDRDASKWKTTKFARKEAGRKGGLKKAENERALANATLKSDESSSKAQQSLANVAVNANVNVINKEEENSNSSKTLSLKRPSSNQSPRRLTPKDHDNIWKALDEASAKQVAKERGGR